jgi:putative PEP-CTERM system integral membrane protein
MRREFDGAEYTKKDAPDFHLWLTYRTLRMNNTWHLPQLAVQRNVFWDAQTVRLVNGKSLKLQEDAWLPASIPALSSVQPSARRVDLPGGKSVLAVPTSQSATPQLPGALRLAVVLDRSRSMAKRAEAVSVTLARIRQVTQGGATADLYLTASTYRGEAPSLVRLEGFDPASLVYYGGQNPAELLEQFTRLRGERAYDAVIVLTDGSGYELGENRLSTPIPEVPVWLVHLESNIPLGYDDRTLELIQASGGGVVGSIEEALPRIALNLASRQPKTRMGMQDIVDGYTWSVVDSSQAAAIAPQAVQTPLSDGFAALAGRRYVLAELQRQRKELGKLETLDQFHALAVQFSMITPYSSMIVLVNDLQRMRLETMEKQGDRFEREFENLTNTTPAVQTPLTGVPEPEEWLLIGLAAAALLYLYRRQLKAYFVKMS